jgi:hypothetical protein
MPLRNPGSVSSGFVVTLNSTTTSSAVAPVAVTEFPGSSRRHRIDLSRITQGMIEAAVSSAWNASCKVSIQLSLDGVTWVYLSGTASGSAPVASEYVSGAVADTVSSDWNTIPTTYRTLVYVRGVTLDGDNTDTGAAGTLALQVR